MLHICRGIPADIDRDIKNLAARAGDELRLGGGRLLAVEPPERAFFCGIRAVILNEYGVYADFRERLCLLFIGKTPEVLLCAL